MMRKFKKGKELWNTIEEAARQKHGVGKEYELTMADLGSPEKRVLGRCVYRLNNKENPAETYAGYVTFDPYK